MFISFDGIDGSGKTTQLRLFSDWLKATGKTPLLCRDPGSTPLGEKIRHLLLDTNEASIGRRAEMFLYMAARAQMVHEIIRPALEAGKIVVVDRFLLANIAYQGYGGYLDVKKLWDIGRFATESTSPELTFVFDLSPEVAAERISRPKDRMEQQGLSFFQRVSEGYRIEAKKHPGKFFLIQADRPEEAIAAEIRELYQEKEKSMVPK